MSQNMGDKCLYAIVRNYLSPSYSLDAAWRNNYGSAGACELLHPFALTLVLFGEHEKNDRRRSFSRSGWVGTAMFKLHSGNGWGIIP